MKPEQLPQKVTPSTGRSSMSTWGRSVLITTALVGAVAATGLVGKGGLSWLIRSSDLTSEQQRHERLIAFNSLAPLPLAYVSDSELPKAIEGMDLTAQDLSALRNDQSGDHEHTAAQIHPVQKQSPESEAVTTSGPKPESANQSAPMTQRKSIRLAWVTLWDTDAEDGDVVRIDSQGYSRTVVLRKQPVTFAIPVPESGIVNVTGIRDGDGGGITVGVASGDAKAVFPIMSEGQTLGLHVRIN